MTFLNGDTDSNAEYMYPVGLLMGLLWFYGEIATGNMASEHFHRKLLGWLHMIGLIVLTVGLGVAFARVIWTTLWNAGG